MTFEPGLLDESISDFDDFEIEFNGGSSDKTRAAANDLSYHPIGIDDPNKIAKFFLNIGKEGLYKDGKLVFPKGQCDLWDVLSFDEAVEISGIESRVMRRRVDEVKEFAGVIGEVDCFDDEDSGESVSPVVLIYALRILPGVGYPSKIETCNALYITSKGLDDAITNGLIETKHGHIIRASVLREQANLYTNVWRVLQQTGFEVPKYEAPKVNVRDLTQVKSRIYESVGIRNFNGTYSFALNVNGNEIQFLLVGNEIYRADRTDIREIIVANAKIRYGEESRVSFGMNYLPELRITYRVSKKGEVLLKDIYNSDEPGNDNKWVPHQYTREEADSLAQVSREKKRETKIYGIEAIAEAAGVPRREFFDGFKGVLEKRGILVVEGGTIYVERSNLDRISSMYRTLNNRSPNGMR
ncbi:hypothetical protein J4216_05695 [Candidatus Woesearchaeota archaeon]|nr:hypothetical protein [Candidatus Woesearchaeota archaeon]